jgi:hypothetical protein
MRHTLRAHILYLETTIQTVRDRLTKPRLSLDEVQDLELQLSLAESALEHYRQAYELELSVIGPEPPERPDGKAKSDAGRVDGRSGERKKDVHSARRSEQKVRGRLPVVLLAK